MVLLVLTSGLLCHVCTKAEKVPSKNTSDLVRIYRSVVLSEIYIC